MFQQEFFKKELVKELRLVEVLMKREENIEKKIYYFSAAYGITSRTYRYAFSDSNSRFITHYFFLAMLIEISSFIKRTVCKIYA
jgi:hypothetical protein